MKKIVSLFLASLVMSAGIASASLKPGEVSLNGEIKKIDTRKKEVTLLVKKLGKELTFPFQDRRGVTVHFNEKKMSHRRFMSKQDEMAIQFIIVYQDIKDFDKTNVDMKGYVVRYVGGFTQEYLDSKRGDKSKR